METHKIYLPYKPTYLFTCLSINQYMYKQQIYIFTHIFKVDKTS